MDLVTPRSPLPWLHIAEVVAEQARLRGFQCLGLTGTRWLVESEVYPSRLTALGVRHVRPDPAARQSMNRIIMDELVPGIIRPESVAVFQQVIGQLKERGCDAVVLGCTEIPLIIGDGNSALPVLDSTRLLARAALQRALADTAAAR
jgi:aspartate racemase